jgi:hypothetical protein
MPDRPKLGLACYTVFLQFRTPVFNTSAFEEGGCCMHARLVVDYIEPCEVCFVREHAS